MQSPTMRIAIFQLLHDLKLTVKIFVIFFILLLLIIDLGSLNITSVRDVQVETNKIADELVPRLIATTEIKDNLNLAILSAYDYVTTGNPASKSEYKTKLKTALNAEIQLFLLSESTADFEFSTSFQDSINAINSALEELVTTYEQGGTTEDVRAQLTTVSASRDAFALFLETEVEGRVQQQTHFQRTEMESQVRRTLMNVSIVGLIALFSSIMLYAFIRQSITKPLQELSAVAEEIGKGNFRPAHVDSKDELGLFAETFNTMIARILVTQDELKNELEKTKKLDRQKTEFLSIAAHQLRTPMAGIKWVVNMTASGDFGEIPSDAKEQLGKGVQNIDRMIALINSLLDVTEIETKGFTLTKKPEDIVAVAKEVTEELDLFAKNGEVTLELKTPTSPLSPIAIDKEKMKIVLHNVIDNAIKYTPKKGTASVVFEEKDKSIFIHVKDTGYGIPPEEQERIFSKFFRGSNIQTVQADGSGLGLFIVQQIVQSHDGQISFESEVGKGTTFTISLPTA